MITEVRESASDFLAAFEVYDVSPTGDIVPPVDGGETASIAAAVAMSGLPRVICDPQALPFGARAAVAFPIYRGGEIASVVVLTAADHDSALGVFEIWEPTGIYEELRLTESYHASLERFENVSSFIRFEKGCGLPGLVWRDRRAAVYNDLPNHPGFQRAAGAGAEALTTAVGIPIFDDDFVASVVLISSAKSPLARGVEIWKPDARGFVLHEGVYPSLPQNFRLNNGFRLSEGEGLPGEAHRHGRAVVSHDSVVFAAGRIIEAPQPSSRCGLALPYYDDSSLTSVVVLLF